MSGNAENIMASGGTVILSEKYVIRKVAPDQCLWLYDASHNPWQPVK
jgi:hypothetical protein